jgi:hypothetical protein
MTLRSIVQLRITSGLILYATLLTYYQFTLTENSKLPCGRPPSSPLPVVERGGPWSDPNQYSLSNRAPDRGTEPTFGRDARRQRHCFPGGGFTLGTRRRLLGHDEAALVKKGE